MKVRCQMLIALKHAVSQELIERGIVQSVPSLTQATFLRRVGIKLPLLSLLPRPLIPWLGHPPGADSIAVTREPTRASRQEDRSGVWRNGVTSRWNSDKGFGFIKPEDGGVNVFVHRSALGVRRDLRLEIGCTVRFEEVFDERKQKTKA